MSKIFYILYHQALPLPNSYESYQTASQVKAEKTPCGEADYQILGG